MKKLIQTRSSPEGRLIRLQLLSVGIVGFRKINVEVNNPFQRRDDQDEFNRCAKKREYGDRPYNMHSRMLRTSHMEIRASPRKHFGRLQKIIGKHVFDLKQTKQQKHSVKTGRQMIPPDIVLNQKTRG